MKNPAPYRYDIVGSFLRTKAIHEARSKFEAGEISAEELTKVEDAEITGLVKKEENVGLHAVTDGEYRRSFWHMDFLWGLTGTQKVKSEHFSVAFKGFQPKAETVKIVDKLDFPDDHPFLKHFAFLQSVASDLVQPKQCIPSPSMLHLICCVRSTDYQPIERYKDEQVLLDDLAAAYQKAVKAFYAAGCRYLQLDDTSWGEFCSAEKRKAYAERGIDVDEVGRKYVYVLNKILEAKPEDMVITMHICRGNFRSTWSSTGGYEPVAEILFGHCNVDGFFLEYDSDRAGGFEPLRYIGKQKVVLGLVTSKDAKLENKEDVIARIREFQKTGKKHFVVIVAEGVGGTAEIAKKIEAETGVESRATILGHVQRGGSPTARDRIMASQMGSRAVDLLTQGIGNRVIGIRDIKIVDFDIFEALKMTKTIDMKDYELAHEISI